MFLEQIRYHFFVLLVLLVPAGLWANPEEPVSGRDAGRNSVMGQSNPLENGEEPALWINEPMYFVLGRNDGDTRARFQFSFKLRMFDNGSVLIRNAPWLEKLHLAYSQTSLWNLSAASSPFEDTSYRPSFFWEFPKPQIRTLPELLRFGYEHESNGQGDEPDGQGRSRSRSIDTLFIFPFWTTQVGGRTLVAGPKVYGYVSKGHENQDIARYRGHTDLIVRYGNEDSWLVNALWRHGTENHNTVQLDLSYPFRKKFFSRTGGYFYVQTFSGYGESLLTYDQRQDFTVRFGFAIVR